MKKGNNGNIINGLKKRNISDKNMERPAMRMRLYKDADDSSNVSGGF